ncbi:Mitochondrial metalloendopeptidase [Arachis hypogaea]|nr:Mitochondrial metalloendopeptidase [Arachis hypogaea]
MVRLGSPATPNMDVKAESKSELPGLGLADFVYCAVLVLNSGLVIAVYSEDKLNSTWREAFMKAYKSMDKELRESRVVMGSKDLKSLTNASAYCKAESGWHKEDEILDDSWVQQSRKKGPATSHLNGLNWEVLVVNELDVNAFWLPGGKIVVYTGLLEHFKSDAEIATIIGHEEHANSSWGFWW